MRVLRGRRTGRRRRRSLRRWRRLAVQALSVGSSGAVLMAAVHGRCLLRGGRTRGVRLLGTEGMARRLRTVEVRPGCLWTTEGRP